MHIFAMLEQHCMPLSDDLLDHIEGRKVEQGTIVENGTDQSSIPSEIEVCIFWIVLT